MSEEKEWGTREEYEEALAMAKNIAIALDEKGLPELLKVYSLGWVTAFIAQRAVENLEPHETEDAVHKAVFSCFFKEYWKMCKHIKKSLDEQKKEARH